MNIKIRNKLHWMKSRLFYIKIFKRYMKERLTGIRTFPTTIQLPITYLCNFDCVMCGMHHMAGRKDFTAEELGKILTDKLFQEGTTVGVNGGEPFLKKDFVDCIKAMMAVLPKLKTINIISNGYFTDKILANLSHIRKIALEKQIQINLSVSVDGIGSMQDFHRGRVNAFKNAQNTIVKVLAEKDHYVDNLDIICTITKYNIECINEVDVWAKQLQVSVAYNIATVNVRIENENKLDDFSVFADEHCRMLAVEFFYCQFRETQNEKYFAIYLYLSEHKRFSDCPCRHNEWITLTPDTQIGFCATHSKNLGSGLEKSAYKIVEDNMNHLHEIKKNYCHECSHYTYSLNSKGLLKLFKDRENNYF